MTKFARRSEAAEIDLQELAYHIAVTDGRMKTSERLIDELINQAENLAKTSDIAQMGTASPELGQRVRLFTYKRWVIIFRYEAHGIDVLRIVDGSQDFLTWKLG